MAETKNPGHMLPKSAKPNSPRSPAFPSTASIPKKISPSWNPEEALGYPGEPPYTRGIYPSMYRGRLWTMRQYAGFGSAAESNQRYRYLLSKGQSGLSVAFDLPTQIGMDSDHPSRARRSRQGRRGHRLLEDMETLFDGIPLEKVSTSMTINSTAAILLCLYVAVAKKQGANLAKLSGTVQNDILKEYIARGTYIYPVRPAMRIVTDVFAWCRTELPKWNTISISGYHIREAGSTAVQEVAFTLGQRHRLRPSRHRRRPHGRRIRPATLLLLQRAQRPARRNRQVPRRPTPLGRIMQERFHARDPRSLLLRFHAQTAGSSLTAQQPENNIVRVAIQALAAVLGGCQSLHTNSMDEALALPTEDAALIALRTQQIIAHETGVANTIDPVAGSYAIESLTNEIETGALAYIEKIDATGGMLRAIESGFVQGEIQKAAYEYQRA